jgi:hypothetical protein
MRSFFLRLRSIVIAICFIIVLTGFLVLPEQVIRIAEEINNQEDRVRLLSIVTAVLADFILIYIIWTELRVRHHHDENIFRSRSGGAEITLDSVQKNLESQLGKVDMVYGIMSEVRNERGKVAVDVEVGADENVNVPKKTSEINREVKKVVERQMGLKLAEKPQIRFRLLSQPAPAPSPMPRPAAPLAAAKPDAKSEEKGGKGRGRFFGRDRDSEKPDKAQLADPDSQTARPAPPMPSKPPPTQNFFSEEPSEGHITDKIPPKLSSEPRVVPLVSDLNLDEDEDDS